MNGETRARVLLEPSDWASSRPAALGSALGAARTSPNRLAGALKPRPVVIGGSGLRGEGYGAGLAERGGKPDEDRQIDLEPHPGSYGSWVVGRFEVGTALWPPPAALGLPLSAPSRTVTGVSFVDLLHEIPVSC